MSVDPRGLTLREWADAAILTTSDAWPIGSLMDEERWQDWAVSFVSAPAYAQQGIPDPYGFSDWHEWAQRVYPMLEGI